MIDKTHVLYNRCLCVGDKFLIEFSNIFIPLIIDNTL